jgi:hypothetical protein
MINMELIKPKTYTYFIGTDISRNEFGLLCNAGQQASISKRNS